MSRYGVAVSRVQVFVNVYDLSPGNEYLYPIGLGAYHSGLEVLGDEWTFSDGGVFSHTPKDVPSAPLRISLSFGETKLTRADVDRAVAVLRDSFPPGSYNVIHRNCNHFANALLVQLMGHTLPGWVNRSARLGSYFSCLLPPSMLSNAPVTDGGAQDSAGGSGSRASSSTSETAGLLVRGASSKSAPSAAAAFSGAGNRLGATSGSGGAGSQRSVSSQTAATSSSTTTASAAPVSEAERRAAIARATHARLAAASMSASTIATLNAADGSSTTSLPTAS